MVAMIIARYLSTMSTTAATRQMTRDAVVIALLALATSCAWLGTKSLWLDEAFSVEFVLRGPLDMMLRIVYREPNMCLYYALLKVWIALFGTSEWITRLPSAICVSLAAPIVYLIGVRLFSRRAGLVAGGLVALNGFVVHYGQTTRAYALVMLLVTLASWFFVRELERPSPMNRLAYVVSGALAFHAHIFAALVLVAHFLALIAIRRRQSFTRETAVTAGALILLCAPLVLIAQRVGPVGIAWIPRPTLNDVGATFVRFAGGSSLFLTALITAAIVGVARRDRLGGWSSTVIILTWLLVPVTLAFAVSQVRPMYQARYLIIVVPPLLLAAGAAVDRIRPPIAAAVAALGLALLSATGLHSWYSSNDQEDWRGAVSYVLATSRPHDRVVFAPPYVKTPFNYYQRRSHRAPLDEIALQDVAEPNRVWLVVSPVHVLSFQPELEEARAALASGHRLESSKSFTQIEVELYVQ